MNICTRCGEFTEYDFDSLCEDCDDGAAEADDEPEYYAGEFEQELTGWADGDESE